MLGVAGADDKEVAVTVAENVLEREGEPDD